MIKKEFKILNSHITLYNSDCKNTFSLINKESIDLIIVDPPYGIGIGNKFYNINESNWDKFKYDEFTKFTSEWLLNCQNILKENGTLWMFFAPTKIHDIFKAIETTNFINHLNNWTIYARGKGRGTSKKLKSLREDIFHLTKNKIYTWNMVEYLRKCVATYHNAGGSKRGWDYLPGTDFPARWSSIGNIIAFSSEPIFEECIKKGTVLDISSGLPIRFDGYPSDVTFFVNPSYTDKFDKAHHSCQKPILLLTMLTMLSSLQGETVLDPFMGSGSSAIAAILSERNYIGIEKESDTYNRAVKWITEFPYELGERYIKAHTSSTEKFKFGHSERSILKK